MTGLVRRLPLAVLVLAVSSSARADTILFSTTETRSSAYDGVPFATSALLYWGVYKADGVLNQMAPLFENRLFTEADIGATFAADSTSDPDFAYIVSVLTNGHEDNGLKFATLSPEGTGDIVGESESDFFAGLGPRLGTDLFGYDVRRITFTIDHLAFLPPVPSDSPNIVGNIEGRFTLRFRRRASAADPGARHGYAARDRVGCAGASPSRASRPAAARRRSPRRRLRWELLHDLCRSRRLPTEKRPMQQAVIRVAAVCACSTVRIIYRLITL